MIRNSEEIPLKGNTGGRTGETYSHYVIMDEARKFLRANKDHPFLAIVWFHAPHLPVVASAEDAKSYDDGQTSGFQQNYYGCVTALDRAVGRLRASLREHGIAENTIVTFLNVTT